VRKKQTDTQIKEGKTLYPGDFRRRG